MFVSLCFSVAMETKIIFLSICHCQNIKILTDIIRDSLHICHMFNTPSSNAWLPGQACCFLFSDFCCFFSFWLTKWKALEYFWEHVERRSLCHEPTISQIQCSLTVKPRFWLFAFSFCFGWQIQKRIEFNWENVGRTILTMNGKNQEFVNWNVSYISYLMPVDFL